MYVQGLGSKASRIAAAVETSNQDIDEVLGAYLAEQQWKNPGSEAINEMHNKRDNSLEGSRSKSGLNKIDETAAVEN